MCACARERELVCVRVMCLRAHARTRARYTSRIYRESERACVRACERESLSARERVGVRERGRGGETRRVGEPEKPVLAPLSGSWTLAAPLSGSWTLAPLSGSWTLDPVLAPLSGSWTLAARLSLSLPPSACFCLCLCLNAAVMFCAHWGWLATAAVMGLDAWCVWGGREGG